MAVNTAPPIWWKDWGGLVTQYANEFMVPIPLIAAIIQQESGGDPTARSPKGANGLMQVVGGSFNPAQNIAAGVKYFRQQLDTFNGDVSLALAAYNAGPGAVQQYKGIPPYAETQRYVPNVLALWRGWANVLGPTLGPDPNATGYPSPGSGIIPGGTLPPVPLPGVPSTDPFPGSASSAFLGGVGNPALAPEPYPAATGFWPLDVANNAQVTIRNGIKSAQKFFYILFGLILIALGIWLLTKAEANNERATNQS